MRLNEVFNRPVVWHVSLSQKQYFIAKFAIDDGLFEFTAQYKVQSEIWEIDFTRDDRTLLTNTGDEFSVFATVRQILEHFIQHYQPVRFKFSSYKSEPSRISLYDRMSSQIASHYGYKLSEDDSFSSKYYIFSKEPSEILQRSAGAKK